MMRSHLFTVVMEFDGATSVSQFLAPDVDLALRSWLRTLTKSDRYGLSPASADALRKALLDSQELTGSTEPVPVQGMTNVWCTTCSVERKHALLNIVQTSRR
jgi:hypothetical protein